MEQLPDALSEASRMGALHREILGLFLARLDLIEEQMQTLDRNVAKALQAHHEAVQRLAEIPGFGIASAQQVIAEVGPTAASFPTPEQLSSWVGTCPGREESAEVSKSNRSPNPSSSRQCSFGLFLDCGQSKCHGCNRGFAN